MKKLPVFPASRIAAKGAGRHVIGCRVQVGSPRHQFDAVGQQLDMAELLRRDGGDQAVERLQLALVEEVEALEEVVIQRGTSRLTCRRGVPGGRRPNSGLPSWAAAVRSADDQSG